MEKVRIKSSIILVAITGLLISVVVISKLKGSFFYFGSHEEINNIISRFRQNVSPLIEINLTSLYGGNGRFQVLHPLLSVNKLNSRETNPSCNEENIISQNSLHKIPNPHCEKRTINEEEIPYLKTINKKVEELEQFLNNKNKLPDNFVMSPPFIDEWGNSFAYLLTQKI